MVLANIEELATDGIKLVLNGFLEDLHYLREYCNGSYVFKASHGLAILGE